MSGFQGGDFFCSTGIGGGSSTGKAFGMQYRHQLGSGFPVDPAAVITQRTGSAGTKRSIAELQQQALFLRSVKQRTHQTSPISPLSPVSPEISNASSASALRSYNYPTLPLQSKLTRTPDVSLTITGNRQTPEADNDAEKTMRNRLQELERQLLEDDDSHEDIDCSAASTVTNSEWSDAMQRLIVPPQPHKPAMSSPSSSSSGSSASASSPSVCSTAALSAKQQLTDAAEAISEGSIESASAILSRLKGVFSTRGGNSDHRLMAHLVQALLCRVSSLDTSSQVAELYSREHVIATQMLYDISPCFKLGFMAANLTILEQSQDQAKIHIIDFDIGQGNQYISLIQALADRRPVNASVKITAVSERKGANPDSIQSVGDRLKVLAERIGVNFCFNAICLKLSDISRETLGCEEDEALAVNFAFHLFKVPDESVSLANPRDELLRLVKSLGARLVTLAEQEMSANTATFLARFREAESYYGALFDSLDATMTRERSRVEDCLGRKVMNAIAREGRDRVERCEVFGKWRARMGMAGFVAEPISSTVAESLRNRITSIWTSPGLSIKEESGGLCFGWNGRVLTVTSAWR